MGEEEVEGVGRRRRHEYFNNSQSTKKSHFFLKKKNINFGQLLICVWVELWELI